MHTTLLNVADWRDEKYDQVSLSRWLLNTAYKFRLLNHKTFWVLLDRYTMHLDVQGLESKYPGTNSLVFKVRGNANNQKLSTPDEYHDKYGGLYRLNVHDVLQGVCLGLELGKQCIPIDEEATSLSKFVRAVVISTSEEAEMAIVVPSARLRSSMRSSVFSRLGIHPEFMTTDLSIAETHRFLFNKYRSDILVFDSDFLPLANQDPLLIENLAFRPNKHAAPYVHLWYARNPVNGLEYGHGGPKLFPRDSQVHTRESWLDNDFTLSVGQGLAVHPIVLGDHCFNDSAYSSWTTAAKECAKLTKATEKRDHEAATRLQTWITVADSNQHFYKECLEGANFGHYNSDLVLTAMSKRTGLKKLFDEFYSKGK